MTREELISGYTELLERNRWLWFITLTFRGYPPVRKADRAFFGWLEELEREEAANDFCWAKVTEMGRSGENAHFHVLMGGLRHWHGATRGRWMWRWNELAGEARIDYFRDDRGGVEYMLKGLSPARDFAIDFRMDGVTVLQERGPNVVL